MPAIEPLFREYEAFHKDPRNKLCHYLGITIIVFSVVSALAFIPVGIETRLGRFDLSWVAVGLTTLFYLSMDVALGVGALLVLGGMAYGARYVPHWGVPLGLFLFGWALQFIGHYFEGKKPAFLRNAVHLLVGPLWILSHFYEVVGLRARAAAPLLVLLLAIPAAHEARAQEDEARLAPETKLAADLQAKADDLLIKDKKFDDAIATYQKLIDHLEANKAKFTDFPDSQQRAVRAHAFYNMACAQCLSGKRDQALDTLKNAIEAGFYDWQHLEKDDDLKTIREEPRFKDLVMAMRGTDKEARRLEKLVKETIKEKPLFDFSFEVTTLEAEKVKLADYKGKTVVVVCFGTWNPRCKEMAPALVQLAMAIKERGDPVQIVVLDWERTDPTDQIEKDVKDFIAEQKMAFPVALMKEKDPTLDRIPDLRAFPTTLWVDKNGKVRARWDDEKVLNFDELDAITKGVLHDEKGSKNDAQPKEKKPDDKKKPDKKKEDEPF
jgi:uncharacterized membrane protein YGL010W/thiol-disulfide isomerase/thioredoxin